MPRVLVVEDDALQAGWLCDLLDGSGVESVGPAADLQAAGELLDSAPIDAAVLDIRLRDGLCFGVARRLVDEGIPFLFLTGSLGDVIPQEFQAIPVLYKPAEPAALLLLLRTILPDEGERSAPIHPG